ncbi:MAG: GAF domain-containing protein [Cyclobacteriaceae bacterium]|nr:GAF domain-containing protein [Cyclobacteriaceae bacterium]
MNALKEYIHSHGLIASLYFILILLVINSLFTFYSRQAITRNSEIKEQIIKANHGLEFMNKNVNLVDLGFRGYMIEQDVKFLSPYDQAIAQYKQNLDSLGQVLNTLGFDIKLIVPAEQAIDEYMILVQRMVKMCAAGDAASAKEILLRDPGYDAWKIYSVFEQQAQRFVNETAIKADDAYRVSTRNLVIGQFIYLLLCLPILSLTISSLIKGKRNREQLFAKLNESNRKYIFNDGADGDDKDESAIINHLITNLSKASAFIGQIADGNYKASWDGFNDKDTSLNKENIAGKLLTMREQMKKVKAEDDIRLWVSQGLAEFGTIIRNNENDIKILSEKIISRIVQYLEIQMGGLFILNEEDEHEEILELTSCYAYERLKFIEKKVAIGQGLVGQCYLEGESIYMTNVPQDYMSITSGLGDTRPGCVLIIPLKMNNKIEGIIELASLNPFPAHQIEFLEKLGEALASAITTVRTSENTKILLERSQQQTEEMRAQEEEMRQNMEELQATQEQMHRKNEEVEELLRVTSEKEAAIAHQNELILEEKKELEKEEAILSVLMELLPERITIKDRHGRYLKLSEAKYSTLREQGFHNVIGKSDKEVFSEDHFMKSFGAEQALMNSRKPVMNVEEQIQIAKDRSIWGLTSRIPFMSTNGDVLGTIAITRDVSKEKQYEEEITRLKNGSTDS